MPDLNRLFDILKGKRVFIQGHNFPDADAIASSFGIQTLLKLHGIPSTIIYVGQIEQFNTALMIETLELNLVNLNDIKDMTSDDYVIIVDAQKNNANIFDSPGDEVACIDHHPTFKDANYRYSDIRPEIGACSSIVAKYFLESKTQMDTKTATTLLYGIKMDTKELSRGVSELDIDMFHYLYKKADLALINRLQTKTMELKDLKSFGTAIQNIQVFGNLAIAKIDGSFPDGIIAATSDFILAAEEIDIMVVYSKRPDGIKLSVRSCLPEYNAGEATAIALYNLGEGGGHAEMAGKQAADVTFPPQMSTIEIGRAHV